jgi:carbonic anhydrase
VEKAIVANVQLEIEKLKTQSNILADAIQSGKLKIVGGRYDLDKGEVTMVG